MKKRKEIILLAVLIFLFFIINYSYLDRITGNFLNEFTEVHVTRVIDGDTIVTENYTIRMLGINTPERKDYLYEDARDFLNDSIFNKSVRLEFGKEEKDKYNRTLAYVFYNGENIDLKMIEMGFANPYFLKGKDRHYNKFFDAWNGCIEKNKNLCEKSTNKCSSCISLKKFDVYSEEIILYNQCEWKCEITNWSIKNEGRKKFIFPKFVLEGNEEVKIIVEDETNSNELFFWNEKTVWTKTGDTLFLRDEKGKLVLWKTSYKL